MSSERGPVSNPEPRNTQANPLATGPLISNRFLNPELLVFCEQLLLRGFDYDTNNCYGNDVSKDSGFYVKSNYS